MSQVQFTVNGIQYKVDERVPRETSLNAYLRYWLALPGTKAMCHEGGCGSCIVMVRARRHPSGKLETFTVNSCLVLVFSCHGWAVSTVEGVGDRARGYSDVQKRIVGFTGTQCGYCTPGWVMHLTSLRDKNLTMEELEHSFGSNTCRCTGFRPILDTVKSFAVDANPELCRKVRDIEDATSVCEQRNNCHRKCSEKSDDSDWDLLEDAKTIALKFDKHKFYKVYYQDDIFSILKTNGVDSYMLIDGNTGKGIVDNFVYPDILIDISDVASLKGYQYDQNLVLGANVSLEDCIGIFKEASTGNSDFAYLSEFVKHLQLVAHIPVRKIGSIAGNLMYKRAVPTYQSDLFLLLACVGATVTICNPQGRSISLSILEFIKFDMKGNLMVNVKLPPLSNSHIFRSYKIMPRNQNALAIVNAAFLIKLNKRNVIEDATFVFGNISPDFVHASATEAYVIDKNVFKNEGLQGALKVLSKELVPAEIEGEPSVECRKKLALGLFYKFILNITPRGMAIPKYTSGGELLKRPVSSGKQDYQTDPSLYPLNQPVPKLEGSIQASGEAQYVNDMPPLPREVFGAFVLSTVHSGEVDTIDIDAVLAIDGVVALYTVKDIPGANSFIVPGLPLESEEEEILATKIKCYSQPIAIVIAKTQELAARVAKQVKVTYKNVSTAAPVLTIDAAKKDSKRYISSTYGIAPTTRGSDVKKVITGVYELGAQYAYYMEPITCLVRPMDNVLEVFDSAQCMDLTQIAIARSLGIKESDIVVRVRRVGGAFGGKISRNAQTATACALVAKKLNVPCRFILPLHTNLTAIGKRMPSQCEYEVGVDNNGKIQYLNATIVEDNGCSNNESILQVTAVSFHNCYVTDTWTLKTADVLTDLPSNSFLRAPGSCEGISSIEHIMEHIAFSLNKDPTDVRLANMRTDDNDIPELIEILKQDANYDARAQEIKNFNRINRWVKKAIKISVMLYPIAYAGNYCALVSVYRGDGTVTISTGGIEMGQGINTKVAQVCAYELGVPLSYVRLVPNYTFVAANESTTGGSITSESVCYAVIKASAVIKERLAPLRRDKPTASWMEIVQDAGEKQIDLTSLYMMAGAKEDLKGYSAFAVAIIETKLDVLTGRFQIERADILEDVGVSANPQVDVGQVEGAYIQGIGYFTCEKLVYDKATGRLLTNRSLNYHVPLCLDIPVQFNVKLRYNSKNPNGVLGSKACGEMGICTAHGVTHALRQCIMESRKDSGYDVSEWINIAVPYDTEAILKALDVRTEEFLITP